jgi:diaminopimelate epimerase
MSALEFTKYEGLGNDFIVVDGAVALARAQVEALCDRHFGIGADGVLVVGPPTVADADAQMIVVNADGTRPEMCGNGLRCAALHLARQRRITGGKFRVQTDAGVLDCEIAVSGNWGTVQTALGRGVVAETHQHGAYSFQLVSTGNPHAIWFGEIPPLAVVDEVGSAVCGELPGGANVEFVEVISSTHLRVVVWERGVGRTLACGTGAAACAVAAVAAGKAPAGIPLRVGLPGGDLTIEVAGGSYELLVEGPAALVFSGRAELASGSA